MLRNAPPPKLSICCECFKQLKKLYIRTDSIEIWQNKWSNFLQNIVDEIIVFSNSTKNILKNFYPDIKENKIKTIPHYVPPIRKVSISKLENFNIGILGIISVQKGALILEEIDKLLPEYPHLQIKIIGSCDNNFNYIKTLGSYKLSELPDIIEKEKIDIIFIPSVCPETFSYTTSEALNMGLPVACFNIGAPAERIQDKKNGIIISKINAKSSLDEITEFLNNYILNMEDK